MVFIELAVMNKMYPNKKLNYTLIVGSLVLALAFFGLIRVQAGVGNRQFIRSMIPHHSGAILMCRRATIDDAELKTLCVQIVESQQREIDQMIGILGRLK